MDTQHSNGAMCSNHSDEIAKAVCISTKELLCFQCCIEKAQTYVPVKEIEKMSNGVEKLIVDCLLAKQKAQRKNNYIDIYKMKAEDAKKIVREQIQCFYEKLSEKIVKMKDNTLLTLDAKYTSFLEVCNEDEQKVNTTMQMINEHLDKLSEGKEADLDKFKEEWEEIMKILGGIIDHESCPEAGFYASKKLQEVQIMSESTLGEVYMSVNYHYEKLGPVEGKEIAFKTDNEEKNFDNKPPAIPPKPDLNTYGSDELVVQKPKVTPRAKNTKGDELGSKNSLPVEKRSSGASIEDPKEDPKEKKTWNFFSRPKRKSNKQGVNLSDYEDFDFKNKNPEQEVRYLVNKTLTLSEFPEELRTSLNFTKLVSVGLSRVGLLSEKHSSIFICGLDGKIQCSNTYPKDALMSIVEMTDDMIAVLSNNVTKIETVKVTDKKFEVKNTITVKLDISKITGFDYSKTKPQFAIGTEREFVVLDKKGKKLKTMQLETRPDSQETITIYDFEKNIIFIINKTLKSIKCVGFPSAEVIWKRKREDPLFQPESACLYQGKLYIASSHAVIQFSTADGKPERTYETDDLIQNCLGLCVIDRVFAISSNSPDPEESKKLGFLAL